MPLATGLAEKTCGLCVACGPWRRCLKDSKHASPRAALSSHCQCGTAFSVIDGRTFCQRVKLACVFICVLFVFHVRGQRSGRCPYLAPKGITANSYHVLRRSAVGRPCNLSWSSRATSQVITSKVTLEVLRIHYKPRRVRECLASAAFRTQKSSKVRILGPPTEYALELILLGPPLSGYDVDSVPAGGMRALIRGVQGLRPSSSPQHAHNTW